MTWKSAEIAPKSHPILAYGVFPHKAEVVTSRHIAEIHWSNWWGAWLDPLGNTFNPELWAELPVVVKEPVVDLTKPVCNFKEPVCDREEDN